MPIDDGQITELQTLWPGTARYEEGGKPYFLIPNLPLPTGCTPASTDALLCVHDRDGYPSRLYFANVISSSTSRNWNHQHLYILDRAWNAFSWRVEPATARLAQIVRSFLRALE